MEEWYSDWRLRRGEVYASLADTLEQAIRSGRLPPGSRLPTHRDLAKRLGVAVSTVSRAYAEATERGLIDGAVGRGTFVLQTEQGERRRLQPRGAASAGAALPAADAAQRRHQPQPQRAASRRHGQAPARRAEGRRRQGRPQRPRALSAAAGAAEASRSRRRMAARARRRRSRRRRLCGVRRTDRADDDLPRPRAAGRHGADGGADLAGRAFRRPPHRHPHDARRDRRRGDGAGGLRDGVPDVPAALRLHHADPAQSDDGDGEPRPARGDRAHRPRPQRPDRRGRRLRLSRSSRAPSPTAIWRATSPSI